MRKSAQERLLDAIFGKSKRPTMKVNVKDGTPQFGKSLCITCKSAGIVKGQNGEIVIHCHNDLFSHLRGNVPFRVSECNEYRQINSLSKHEMTEIAWNIEARRRGPKGFEIPAGESEMEIVVTKPKKKDSEINWPDE